VPGVVVAVIERGEPAWTGAFGMADPATGRPMTPDALFRVESLSKPVAAWGAMRLAEAGRLDLDAPVTECVTRLALPEGLSTVTPRQLLSHTAGLGLGDYAARYPPGAPRPSLAEQIAREMRVIAPQGTRFAYSDTGYALLELAMEECAGADFTAFMARELLAPLGMTGASFDWPGREMPVGHDLRARPVAPYVYPARASGGLHATAGDIARFAAAGMAGAPQPVLSPEGVAALHRPVVEPDGLFGIVAEGYGLGHFTETLSDGRAAVWHGGQGYGWMSHMHLVPESGDGIVILANSQRAWPLFAAILRDWSESIGAAPVGMSRVLRAEPAARAAIAALLIVAALSASRALRREPPARGIRLAAGGLGAAAIGWALWAATRDYLFLFSILPGLWPWLAAASALAGLGLALLALAPARPR
jgi:CubicO group peptidase (beta-lactamase class C family)